MNLGIVGRQLFSRRVGRHQAFNHSGNVATAALAGLAGYLIDPAAVLWIVALVALASGRDDPDGRHRSPARPWMRGRPHDGWMAACSLSCARASADAARQAP